MTGELPVGGVFFAQAVEPVGDVVAVVPVGVKVGDVDAAAVAGEALGDLVGVAAAGQVAVGPDNTGRAGQNVLGELGPPLAGPAGVRRRHKPKLAEGVRALLPLNNMDGPASLDGGDHLGEPVQNRLHPIQAPHPPAPGPGRAPPVPSSRLGPPGPAGGTNPQTGGPYGCRPRQDEHTRQPS